MTTDRVFLVGILWALVLLGLLVVREVLRVSGRPGAKVLLPGLNILVVVMVCAFSLAAVLRLAALIQPAGGPTPTGGIAAASATPIRTPPRHTPTIQPSPTTSASVPTPVPSPRPTPVPTPTPSPSPRPTPVPTPRPTPVPTPRPTPVPTPRPTPVPTPVPTPTPSPSPRPTPVPTPTPAVGTVTVGSTFVSYTVEGDRVTGFRTISVESGFQARSTNPSIYRLPSFSDPNGKKLLVRIVSGPYADVYVSPDDTGVTFQPGG